MPTAITHPDHVKTWGKLNKQQWSRAQTSEVTIQHRHRYDNVIDDRNETGLREGVRQRAHIPSPQLKLRPSFALGRTFGRNKAVDNELLTYEIAFNVRRPWEPAS
jgi:hypothetical protein